VTTALTDGQDGLGAPPTLCCASRASQSCPVGRGGFPAAQQLRPPRIRKYRVKSVNTDADRQTGRARSTSNTLCCASRASRSCPARRGGFPAAQQLRPPPNRLRSRKQGQDLTSSIKSVATLSMCELWASPRQSKTGVRSECVARSGERLKCAVSRAGAQSRSPGEVLARLVEVAPASYPAGVSRKAPHGRGRVPVCLPRIG
jgi:hypothetical protein